MKNNLFIKVAIILIAGFVLTGCTQTDDGNDTQVDGPVTLQWWGVFLDPDVVDPLIQEYQNLNPNVTIEYANKWPGGSRELSAKLYQDELDRVLRENNPVEIPDIFMVENSWVGNYERYVATSPSDLYDFNTFNTAFYPAVVQDFANGNSVRGVPLWIDTYAVIYNRDLLAEKAISSPPDNWIDFRNTARLLTEETSGRISQAGFGAGISENVDFTTALMNILFVQNEVTVIDSLGLPSLAFDTDTPVALEFYQSFSSSTDPAWSDDLRNDSLEFLEGNLAMMFTPSWRYRDILEFNSLYDLGLDIGVASVPQLEGQLTGRVNWANYWGNMVALNRPNSRESWEFLTWLSQPAQLIKLRQNDATNQKFFSFLYPRKDMQQQLQTDQYLRIFNSDLNNARTLYMIDGQSAEAVFDALISSNGSSSAIARFDRDLENIIQEKGTL